MSAPFDYYPATLVGVRMVPKGADTEFRAYKCNEQTGKSLEDMIAGGAGVAALAAMNAAIRKNASRSGRQRAGWRGPLLRLEVRTESSIRLREPDTPGPPVVFIHGVGAGSSSFMWRKNFDVLARDFSVYALDLLGFGFSEKPEYRPLLRRPLR